MSRKRTPKFSGFREAASPRPFSESGPESAGTQEKAAEEAGLHPRHYQKLEEGSVNVTIGTLERLCRGFGVDVRRLFET